MKYYTGIDSCLTFYKQFNEAIDIKKIEKDRSSATFYYQKLKLCSNDVDLILRANSKLIAAIMDSVQQIINNSLVGKKLVSQQMYESGIRLLDEVLKNNDIKIPEPHIKNLRRYMFVTNQVLWNPILPAKTYQTYLTIIDTALIDEPDAAYLLNTKGIVYMRLNKNTEAIGVLQKALESSPSWLMPKYYLGIAYSKQNKYQKALNYYEEILVKDPELKSFECTKCIIEEMAGLSEKIKDNEKAINYYNKNLDLFPEYINSYSGLYSLITNTKNKKAADELIIRLYKFNDSMYTRVMRIRLFMEFYKTDKKIIAELIDSVELIVTNRFDSADLELLRGTYSVNFYRYYEEAYDHFTNAMNLIPDDFYYIEDLLTLLRDYGNYKEMEKIIKEKLDNYTQEDKYKLSAMLGISYIGQKKLKEAFNEFKKLYDIGAYTCDDIKGLNKYLKKLPEYTAFIKKCNN